MSLRFFFVKSQSFIIKNSLYIYDSSLDRKCWLASHMAMIETIHSQKLKHLKNTAGGLLIPTSTVEVGLAHFKHLIFQML